MSPAAAPMVDVADIQRLVGPASFQRGLSYARGGAVSALNWDADARMLTGRVLGSESSPYRCSTIISAGTGKPTGGVCSCPVGFDCKHVAAILLHSNTVTLQGLGGLHLAKTEEVTAPPVPSWKLAVAALTEAPGTTRAAVTRLGLLFELREQIPRSRSQWNGPAARTANAASVGQIRLGVRPVTLGSTGNWTRGSITWNSLGYQSNRLGLAADQQRWFTQFAALHRSTREVFSGQEPDWLYLDDFHSPLFWQLLADAADREIAFVSGKKETAVTIASASTVSLDASVLAPGDLVLSPALSIDGEAHPADRAGTIGDHGVYAWALEPRPAFTLAATSAPLSTEERALLGRTEPVVVPAADVEEFLRDFYPRLRRSIEVVSTDASVQLPEVRPPSLVLTVTFLPKQSLALKWDWDYSGLRKSLRGADDRDFIVEHTILERVQSTAGHGIVSDDTLRGLDAAEFADQLLPTLSGIDGLRVELVGEQPDYTRLTGQPKLTFTTVETDKSDWFDLGVYIRIDGRDVPFTKVFTALSKGHKKLLLVDNSYLSLQQPEFDELRRLIEEASTLAEWETGVRISRYQASLWSEFEDLAEETVEAQAWRDAAEGLLAFEHLEPTALPPTVLATLRPYQKDGFDWLAFLWRHRLGGILADDMGLGKTLQTLALVAHARQPPSHDAAAVTAPFLVVAPTSVVSNWLAEADHFVPSLTVRAVVTGKQSLADLADGADVVVTSYALFRLGFTEYQRRDWSGLILDEAQFVKNPASKAHEAALTLDTPFKLAITGTPMENSLTDLWSLFQIVAPGLFPSGRRFAEEYVRPIATGESPELIAKLRRRIRPLMMRRTKELVATELPEKQEQVLRIDLAPRHRKLYDATLQKERQKLLGLIEDLDRNRFIVFRSLTLLRMLSLDASLVDESHADIPSSKLDALFEQLDDVVAEGHRALIFSQFTSFLKKAADRLDAAGIPFEYLDGSTLHRADVISRFKTGNAPVFLISLKAGGFGLNLTEADYVFLLDPWWNPATETQAVDRTHRIGQTRPVNVYRLVASGTIEEKVMALRDRKAQLFDAVMDDDALFSTALTADDIRALLE